MIRKALVIASALAVFAALHESLHALAAAFYGEYQAFHVRPYGLEVVYRTPVEARRGAHWALISGLPNLVTVACGYILLALRRPLAAWRLRAGRALAYWLTLVCLIGDPLNLSLGPWLYGGDAHGVAVGLGVDVVVIQAAAFVVLLLNRELLAQRLLPAYGVAATHPLVKPLVLLPGSRRGAGTA
jgi:hypothetical protein